MWCKDSTGGVISGATVRLAQSATSRIKGRKIENLGINAFQQVALGQTPLAGRNWINLLKVIPGATPTNTNALNGREYTSTGYSDFKINGKAGSQTQVNLDGGSIVDQGSDAKTSVAPSLESIQEVSALTNNFQGPHG